MKIGPNDLLDAASEAEQVAGRELPCLIRLYAAAIRLLLAFFGPDWVEKHVSGEGKTRPFLRSSPVGGADALKHQDRVISLADMLFNIQDVPGVEDQVGKLRSGDIEASIAALEAAKLIRLSGVDLRFVIATGKKGADYDAELTSRGEPSRPRWSASSRSLSYRRMRSACGAPSAHWHRPPRFAHSRESLQASA